MSIAQMPDKKRILISTKDISVQKEHEEELRISANYDLLTKLPSRMLLAERMKLSIANANRGCQTMAIAYIDLDGFKQVNDTYGHDAGDLLLIEVSKRMLEILRQGDTLARLGGDEFIVILNEQNDQDETIEALQRLLNVISLPNYVKLIRRCMKQNYVENTK
jgi:diguanylate cyclase (GGDEF)-like protein